MSRADEQLSEIIHRSDKIMEIRKVKKTILIEGVMACACMAFLVMTALLIPDVTDAGRALTDGSYGSAMIGSVYVGYVVIGVLGFILGITVTLVLLQYKNLKRITISHKNGKAI